MKFFIELGLVPVPAGLRAGGGAVGRPPESSSAGGEAQFSQFPALLGDWLR